MFRHILSLLGYLNVARITTSSEADMVAFHTDDPEEFYAAKRFTR
jgi:hypothetical protein